MILLLFSVRTFSLIVMIIVCHAAQSKADVLGSYTEPSSSGIESFNNDCEACSIVGLQLLSPRERRYCCTNGFSPCCLSTPLSAPYYPEDQPKDHTIIDPSDEPGSQSTDETIKPDVILLSSDQDKKPHQAHNYQPLNRFGSLWLLKSPLIKGIVSIFAANERPSKSEPEYEISSGYTQNLGENKFPEPTSPPSSPSPSPYQGKSLREHGNDGKYLNHQLNHNNERSQGEER